MKRDLPWGPFPDCSLCDDSGMHDKAGSIQFCRCAAGVKYQAEHPDAAEVANYKLKTLNMVSK